MQYHCMVENFVFIEDATEGYDDVLSCRAFGKFAMELDCI